MTHSYHPDTHEYGLVMGCERCEQHAKHPEVSLDTENILRLLTEEPKSALDEVAAARLIELISIGEKLIAIRDAWVVERRRAVNDATPT